MRDDVEKLRQIAADLHWMARRYADGRQTYATGMFNDATRELLRMGVHLSPGADGTIWARDAGGRAYDHLTPEEAAMGRGPGLDMDDWQRRYEELEAKYTRLDAELKKSKGE